jgi:hypothetical protein
MLARRQIFFIFFMSFYEIFSNASPAFHRSRTTLSWSRDAYHRA